MRVILTTEQTKGFVRNVAQSYLVPHWAPATEMTPQGHSAICCKGKPEVTAAPGRSLLMNV